MIFKRGFQLLAILIVVVGGALVSTAQPRNLLQNADANQGSESWRSFGDATVELTMGNNLCFVVRSGGYFLQDVPLPDDAAGQYAVLIGRGASERINADGAITGLPYLYGYMMDQGQQKAESVLAYLQGQNLLANTNNTDEWVDMWGIFRVPEKTKSIRFFLNQALRQGLPHNGSATRFDNLGVYLFATKHHTRAFVSRYHSYAAFNKRFPADNDMALLN